MVKTRQRLMGAFLALIMVLSIFPTSLMAAASELQTDSVAAIMDEPHRSDNPPDIYVSPTGDDTAGDGSEANPYASLEKAKMAVRELLESATTDIVVELADGFYPMTEVVFGPEDSGREGVTVYYQAAEGARPILSGGSMLEKDVWTLVEDGSVPQAGELDVYKTTLNRDSKLRAIYVNEQRANMTLSGTLDSTKRSTTGVPTVNIRTSIAVPKEDGEEGETDLVPQPWAWHARNGIQAGIVLHGDVGITTATKNPQNIEAERVSGAAKWARPFICFEAVEAAPAGAATDFQSGVLLRYQMPYGAIAQSLSDGTEYTGGADQIIRNAWEFFNKPGDFYFDQDESTLYYIPREGENINTAEVIIPDVNTVIDVRGVPVGDRLAPDPENDADRVKNITFSGLTVAHTDYKLEKLEGSYIDSVLGVRTTNSEGFASIQGCIAATSFAWCSGSGGGSNGSGMNWHNALYRHYDLPPAAGPVHAPRNVRFLDGQVILTGFNGVHIENDVQEIQLTGNVIRDTLAGAVAVGHPTHIYENDEAGTHDSPQMVLTNGFTFADYPADNIPAGGVVAGTVAGADKEKFTAGTEAVPQNIYITNNFMYRSCYGFPGANTLTAFYTTNMQILNNHLEDSTYGAMSIGWGWCEYDGYGYDADGKEIPGANLDPSSNPAPNETTVKAGTPYQGTSERSRARLPLITTTSRANKINYNRIEDAMKVLVDSGTIYTLGRQGDPGSKPGGGEWYTLTGLANSFPTGPDHNWNPDNWENFTEMNYNYVNPDPDGHLANAGKWANGFHPDEGSTFIKMIGNVLRSGSASTGSARLIEFNNWKRKSDMYFINNFMSHSNQENGAPRTAIDSTKNSIQRGDIWSQAAHDTIMNSGLDDRYASLIPKNLLADTDFELLASVRYENPGPGVVHNRRGLLDADDEVWLLSSKITDPSKATLVEGSNMTKAAGNEKTIPVPLDDGLYKMFIKYADGTWSAPSRYSMYVGRAVDIFYNVRDNGEYKVSASKPLSLQLGSNFTFRLNGTTITNGHSISTEGTWTIVATGTGANAGLSDTVTFKTIVADADKLLPGDVVVGAGGKVVFAHDLNDPTKEMWLINASNAYFDSTGEISSIKALGTDVSITAPTTTGTYVLVVLTASDEPGSDKILSESMARVTVVSPSEIVSDLPAELTPDVWFSADKGVETNAQGRVTKWENQGTVQTVNAIVPEASLKPAVEQKVEAIPGRANTNTSGPLVKTITGSSKKAIAFNNSHLIFYYPINGKTNFSILAYSAHTGNGSGGNEDAVVFWNELGSWGQVGLSPRKNNIEAKIGTGQSYSNWTYNRPTQISGSTFTVTALTKTGGSGNATATNSTERLYVDGAQVASSSGKRNAIGENSDLASLGRCINNGGPGTNWPDRTNNVATFDLADLMLFDKALSAEEVQAITAYLNFGSKIQSGKELLNSMVEIAQTLVADNYTPESFDPFETKLTAANSVMEDDGATQEQIDNAYFELRDAFNALVSSLDRSDLNEAIASAKALSEEAYTAETWQVLETALAAAEKVRDNHMSTNADIAKATSDLRSAINGLLGETGYPPNMWVLVQAIEFVDELRSADYTFTSWAKLQITVADGQRIRTLGAKATQTEVLEAAQAIMTAVGKLVSSGTGIDPTSSLADRLLPTDAGSEQGELIGLAYDINDDSMKIWLAPAETTEFVAGGNMTTVGGDQISITAPEDVGIYKLFVLTEDGEIDSTSTKSVTVVEPLPTEGLDLWLDASDTSTFELRGTNNNQVAGVTNKGSHKPGWLADSRLESLDPKYADAQGINGVHDDANPPAVLRPINQFQLGGPTNTTNPATAYYATGKWGPFSGANSSSTYATPTGDPYLRRDAVKGYKYIDFVGVDKNTSGAAAASSRPLGIQAFKRYTGNAITIFALALPQNTHFESGGDQQGLVSFGELDGDGNGWGSLNFGISRGGVSARIGAWNEASGNAQMVRSLPNAGVSVSATELTSFMAIKDQRNQSLAVNGTTVISNDRPETASLGIRKASEALAIGFGLAGGDIPQASAHPFRGRVAQLLIYDRALSTTEIEQVNAYFDYIKIGGARADRAPLNALIVKADYRKFSDSLLDEAKAVVDNDFSTQADIDAAYYPLRTALAALTDVDTRYLEEAVEQSIELLKYNGYSTVTREALVNALNNALLVIANPETQVEVDDALSALNAAISGLIDLAADGARTELSKLTDLSVTGVSVLKGATKETVEAAIVAKAVTLVSAGYSVTFAATAVPDTATAAEALIVPGKFTVTETGVPVNTAADTLDKNISIKVTETAIAVTGVKLNKTRTEIKVGSSEKLVANIAPADATNKAVSWLSSNLNVATVGGDGTVNAIAKGTATITVTTADGNKKATCAVTVTGDPEYKGTVAARLEFANGTELDVIKAALPANVRITTDPATAHDVAVTWNSALLDNLKNFDPANKKAQTIKLISDITLPEGIDGPVGMGVDRKIAGAAELTIVVQAATAAKITLGIDYENELVTGVFSNLEYRFGLEGSWTPGTPDGKIPAKRFVDSISDYRFFTVRVIGDPSVESSIIIKKRPNAPTFTTEFDNNVTRGRSVQFSAAKGTIYSIDGNVAGAIDATGKTSSVWVTSGSKTINFWTPADAIGSQFKSREAQFTLSANVKIYTQLTLNGAAASADYENILTKAIKVGAFSSNVEFKFWEYDSPGTPDASIKVVGHKSENDKWYTFNTTSKGDVKPVTISREAGAKNGLDGKTAIKDFKTILTLKETDGPNVGKEVDYIIVLDTQKPVITTAYSNASGAPVTYNGKTPWKEGDIGVKVQMSDDGSGIRGISWSTNQKPAASGSVLVNEFDSYNKESGIYECVITAPQRQGKFNITVTTYDNTGKSVSKTMPVVVDNSKPQNLTVKIDKAETYEDREFYTVKSFDKLAFAVDALAGSALTKEYRIGDLDESAQGDGYALLSGLKAALKAHDGGDVKVWFRVTSTNGQSAETYRNIVKKAPDAKINKPVLTVGEHITWSSDDDIKKPKVWNDEGITFTVADTNDKPIVNEDVGDNYLARLTYKTSQKGSVEMDLDSDNTFTLEAAGSYSVTISAYDAYGNKASAKAIKVMIDNQEPNIEKAVVKINKVIVEMDGTVYGKKLTAFAVTPAKQSSKVTAKFRVNGGDWLAKPTSNMAISNGNKIDIQLVNAAGVEKVISDFATVDENSAPAAITVKLGGKVANQYGNRLVKAGPIDLSVKPVPSKSTAQFMYILTDSDEAPALSDSNWITYTPKAKPILSKNMKAYLHIYAYSIDKNGNKTADFGTKTVPVEVELSEKAGFSLLSWITG